VNNLPRVVTWQRYSHESNSRPHDCTTPPKGGKGPGTCYSTACISMMLGSRVQESLMLVVFLLLISKRGNKSTQVFCRQTSSVNEGL